MHSRPVSRAKGVAVALIAAICVFAPLHAGAQTSELLDYDSIHHPVIGDRGMVVSQSEIASRIGADVLRRGGNAVDAAVAVAFALAVVLPRAGNLGGDGFMLVHMAEPARTVAIDYRSVAPAAATREFFVNSKGRTSDRARLGHTAAAVPGTVAGLWHAHRKFGTLPWKDLVAPAIELAEKGVALSHDEAHALEWARKRLSVTAAGKRIFFKEDGTAYAPGEVLRQPQLAWSLRQIAEGGADAFYRGEIAKRIAADMARHGGLITEKDLASYRVAERKPISTTYRDVVVVTMPPPSGGGVAVLQMLNVLEQFDLRSLGAGSAASIHLLAEAMKLAYVDRARYVGDPDFVKLPLQGLISKRYAAERARLISRRRASSPPDIAPGDPWRYEGTQTTHLSVADAAGNVVSNTYTLGASYGSGAVIEDAGFLLNDQMKNFALQAGEEGVRLGTSPANALAPSKRMMSTMAPTLVFRDGKPWLVTGTPGGSTILNTILQIIVNVVDHRMNIAAATHAPRIHQQWRPGKLEVEPGFSVDTLRLLESRGHDVEVRSTIGSAQSILIENGRFYGAADPRRPGAAAVAH